LFGALVKPVMDEFFAIFKQAEQNTIDLLCSGGFICLEVNTSISYLEKKRLGLEVPSITKEELHFLISAEFYAIFEIVRHEMPKEDAIKNINLLLDFFNPGWQKVLNIESKS